MSINTSSSRRYLRIKASLLMVMLALVASSSIRADMGSCGGQTLSLPFTDMTGNAFFCQIAEIYFQGITLGTSPTTYSPANNVTREQMAAFLGRTLDTALQRGSDRAALDQFWTTTPHFDLDLGTTTLGGTLESTHSDGLHIWVSDFGDSVYRVRASDGKLMDTWTGANSAYGLLCAMGRVFVTGDINPAGNLYMIDPTGAPGGVTTLTSALGQLPIGIGFDGNKIWTANNGSLSIVTPGATIPWSVTTVAGFGRLIDFAFDGSNMWVTDQGDLTLKKLDANGNVLQTVAIGSFPYRSVFDGKNIWVPTGANTVKVVRASSGEILATLSGNGLSGARVAAFDGERIMVTNFIGNSVSLWKATDFTPLGSFSTAAGTQPLGACSDGQHFWIVLQGTDQLARF